MNVPAPALSIFDILGPVMIGPSSSHTAGAARIGLMGRRILGRDPAAIELGFYGSLAKTYQGHMTDTAVVAGLLGMDVDDIGLPQALETAGTRHVSVAIRTQTMSDKNPNTIEMTVQSHSESRRIVGISVGGGEIVMTAIDDHAVRLDGKHEVVLVFAERGRNIREGIARAVGGPLTSWEVVPGAVEDLPILESDTVLPPDVEPRRKPSRGSAACGPSTAPPRGS